MIGVKLSNIVRRFGDTVALDDISLDIAPGELFFLLGPSGCGKSTLLRIVAGLLAPTSGRIAFNERDVTHLPTQERNAVMCFQSYALWPHMTVRQNLRFGLKVRGISRDEQDRRIEESLKLIRLDTQADRKPNQLSGGQQQRVALARALVVRPDCLLLDEPLSNLDAKLRLEMRSEIRRICKTAGCTTLYVTHDQKEALSVADRLAVLNDGKLIQTGTPAEIYNRPRTSFVADFLGQTNLIPGTIAGREGNDVRVQTALGLIHAVAADEAKLPEQIVISIRPEQIRPVRAAASTNNQRNQITGQVIETTFLGEATEYVIESANQRLKFTVAGQPFQPAQSATIEFSPADALALIS